LKVNSLTEKQEKKGLDVSVRSFLTATAVLLVLMMLAYGLTFVVPGGEYPRIADEAGNLQIDTAGEFMSVQGGIPFWKWLLSPVLVLGSNGGGTLIAVIVFLLVVGGIFNALEKGGLMKYMLGRIVSRFGGAKYQLQAIIVLFFMSMGAFLGSFEECVPMVPLVVALAVSLGWDALTGLGMSILATGCGFASGVCNPFTVGLAQKVAGVPMFSGIWLRLAGFILIYGLLLAFLRRYCRRIEKAVAPESAGSGEIDPAMNRGLRWFAGIFGLGIAAVLSSVVIPALQSMTMVIVAVTFLAAGIAAVRAAGMPWKELGSLFISGLVSIFPAVFMILMASSIKYTMEEARILDTILHSALSLAGGMSRWMVILFIYLLVLVMNFFISSGSAKVFLLMPLIVPLAEAFGISAQLCVLAFAFGDGFSNAFYPTNPVLLISLGLGNVSYGKWAKWTLRFQLLNLALTGGILLLGLAAGYQ